jgi:ribonuclease P protein component
MRPQGYPARLRIKQRRDFLRVQQGGRKLHVEHFLVFVAPRVPIVPSTPSIGDAGTPETAAPETLPTRLGITVTRKIGCAVVRNRIKRLVREVFRRNRERLPSGLDLVFVAKQQAATLEYADVVADFELLIQRALRRGSARGGRA